MPPVLSIGLPVYNGERFVRTAIESLLAQSFQDFELTISDNASTDATRDICREYAREDRRIQYVRQSSNIGLFANVEFVIQRAIGEFCMVVGDDDVYEPAFAAILIGLLRQHESAGLAYAAHDFIDTDGRFSAAPATKSFGPGDSRFRNCLVYMRVRACLPMICGIFRTPVFKRALPFVNFGYTTADVDNVFMVRFLSLATVVSTPEILFHYRTKDRSNILLDGYPTSALGRRLYVFRHQRTVTSLIRRAVDRADFRMTEKLLLKGQANLMLALNTLSLV